MLRPGRQWHTFSSLASKSFRRKDSTQSLKQRSTTELYIRRLQAQGTMVSSTLCKHHCAAPKVQTHLSRTCISSICCMRACF